MATISKRKVNTVKKTKSVSVQAEGQGFYNDRRWDILRNSYYIEHPLCECCLEHGKVVPAENVHHIIPFMSGRTIEIRWNLFLNRNNLCSLCTCCHHAIHDKMKKHNLFSCKELDDDEYNYYHGLDKEK